MYLEAIRYLSQTYSVSLTASSRPALTFFGVQVGVYALAANNMVVVPEAMWWLHSTAAFGVAGVLALVEVLAHHQDDISEMLHETGVDKFLSVFGAFSAALLFGSLGLPVEESVELIGTQTAAQADLTQAVYVSAHSGVPGWLQGVALTTGMGLNLGLSFIRGRIISALDDFGLKGLWQRVETGGILAVLIVIPFLPLLIFAVLATLVLAFASFGVILIGADKVLDRTGRYRCPSCQVLVRQEASCCPSCKEELTPKVQLGRRLPVGIPARISNMVAAVREARINRQPAPSLSG
jgi:hypothetical protein